MNKRKETATRFAWNEIGIAFVIQAARNESRVILNSRVHLYDETKRRVDQIARGFGLNF